MVRLRSTGLCALLVIGVFAGRHPEVVVDRIGALRSRAHLGGPCVPVETLLRQVEAAAAAKQPAEEARLCQLLYTQYPDHPMAEEAYTRAMHAHMAAGDPVSAQRDFERFRALHPQSELLPETMLDMASWQYDAGLFAAAGRTYTDLIALVTGPSVAASDSEDTAPAAPTVWRTLRSWTEHKRQERSRTELERLGRFNQALCYARSGDSDAALRAYDRFLCRFPQDPRAPEAHFQMGVLEQEAGNVDEAVQHFHAVYTAATSSETSSALVSESIYHSGRLFESQRRFDEAVATYRLALPLRPAVDEFRLASMASLAHLIEEREPLRAIGMYREIAERSTQPSWRAVALERLSALESESAVAAAAR